MKKILLAVFILMSFISYSQQTGYFRYDTVRIQRGGGNATLVIENATRNVTGGFLQNYGEGRTKFARALDSVWVDGDSLRFRYGLTTIAVSAPGGGPDFGFFNDETNDGGSTTKDANGQSYTLTNVDVFTLESNGYTNISGDALNFYAVSSAIITAENEIDLSASDSIKLDAPTLNIPDLISSDDTTTFKPIARDAEGRVRQFSYWPGGGVSGGFFTSSTATANTTQDAENTIFRIIDAQEFGVRATSSGSTDRIRVDASGTLLVSNEGNAFISAGDGRIDLDAAEVYIPSLGGFGSGHVIVDNDGKLAWAVDTSGGSGSANLIFDSLGTAGISPVTARNDTLLSRRISVAGGLTIDTTASGGILIDASGVGGSANAYTSIALVDDTSFALIRDDLSADTVSISGIAAGGSSITEIPVSYVIAISDETTAITTGTAKVTFRMPHAMTLTGVRASVNTVSSSGTPTVDINEGGSTILSTKLTIDASEKTSTTAATAAVISDTSLADDAEITIDIDTAGTGAKGLKVIITGTRAL